MWYIGYRWVWLTWKLFGTDFWTLMHWKYTLTYLTIRMVLIWMPLVAIFNLHSYLIVLKRCQISPKETENHPQTSKFLEIKFVTDKPEDKRTMNFRKISCQCCCVLRWQITHSWRYCESSASLQQHYRFSRWLCDSTKGIRLPSGVRRLLEHSALQKSVNSQNVQAGDQFL